MSGWIDRLVEYVSPRRALNRARARVALDMVRHYEAASVGRRTQGWRRTSGDANAVSSGALGRLRDHAHDLVRNNPHARSAVNIIANDGVGWGIVPSTEDKRAMEVWKEWGETTACDADGRNNIYGLEKLTLKTVAISGEALVRRRLRRPEDGLPIPLQIQVLEPDYLDTAKTGLRLPNGGRIVNGVEFDALGRRTRYWLFPEHPGSAEFFAGESRPVPADSVIHVYRQDRPGQVRGVSWFAPVILALKDLDEYQDATLRKQLIAACLAAILTDADGTGAGLGQVQPGADSTAPELDMIGSGTIHIAPPGHSVEIVQPPKVDDYAPFVEVNERMIATGLGVTYEGMTGDYSEMSFSAARLARLAYWANVEDWRWQTMVPQFCDPVWFWAMQVAAIMGRVREIPSAEWTAPPPPMVDPDKEGLANSMLVRTGQSSLSEVLRGRGYNPKTVLLELASDLKLLDELGLVLDCDPRKLTQQGQFQSQPKAEPEVDAVTGAPKKPNGKPIAANGATK